MFASIYQELYRYYSESLDPKHCGLFEEELDLGMVSVLDSSTITLFVDIFKGAGRNAIDGKKKGGLKVHSLVPMGGSVPGLVHLTEAACNDKVFLGQLVTETGDIYSLTKGTSITGSGQNGQTGVSFMSQGSMRMPAIQSYPDSRTISVNMQTEGLFQIR